MTQPGLGAGGSGQADLFRNDQRQDDRYRKGQTPQRRPHRGSRLSQSQQQQAGESGDGGGIGQARQPRRIENDGGQVGARAEPQPDQGGGGQQRHSGAARDSHGGAPGGHPPDVAGEGLDQVISVHGLTPSGSGPSSPGAD
eukprot:TRINITY_DN6667_c0_g2_i1.p1 TRINITY_DN6667_c0_g2~~TRINITY_DN6667_c0_g2_i1.p1  ORF type:complete len:141 (+),score=10.59 TRINITY_DN6667_c0_g2_i1:29-451(+)